MWEFGAHRLFGTPDPHEILTAAYCSFLHEPRLVATVDYDGSSEDIRGGARLGPRWHDARRAIAAGLVGRALDERPEARDAVLSEPVEDQPWYTGSLLSIGTGTRAEDDASASASARSGETVRGCRPMWTSSGDSDLQP